jgi:hypothetical protein
MIIIEIKTLFGETFEIMFFKNLKNCLFKIILL